jgi:glycosidase
MKIERSVRGRNDGLSVRGTLMLRRVIQSIVCVAACFTAQCRSLGSTEQAQVQDAVRGSDLPDIGKAGIAEVELWSRDRVHEAEVQFAASGQKRHPSPDYWGAESVYQIMVDRFNDGDLANNFALVSADQRDAQQSRYKNLPSYHQGGDIKGVTQRLDYIADLGVSTIWLTPVLTNAGGEYHGYCATDFTQVDPNYGTKEDLVEMVREAHKRGIRVILDVVVNHMCDLNTRYAKVHTQSEHETCAKDLDQENERSLPTHSLGQKELNFSQEFFPPLRQQEFFNRCGGNTQSEMEGSGPTSVFGDFTQEMLDFDTRNYDFQEIFTNLLKYWVAYADVDGFRLDAVKHVTPDFTAYLSTVIRDYGQRLGKNHLYMVAEVAGESRIIARHLGKMNVTANAKSLRDRLDRPVSTEQPEPLRKVAQGVTQFPFPGATAVYDFAHSGISRDVLLLKRPSSVLENYFTHDSYYQDIKAQGDPRLNFTLLEIHDWNRFNSVYPHDMARSKLALSYLAVAPGIPVIYYGMEQGFNGQCHLQALSPEVDAEAIKKHCSSAEGPDRHPLYRQDMFVGGMLRLGSTVESIDKLAHIGPSTGKPSFTWDTDPFLDRNQEVYLATRRMLHLRRSCYPLRYGDIAWRWSSEKNGDLFAFSRLDYGREVLVVVNPGEAPVRVPQMTVSTAGIDFVNVEDTNVVAHSAGSDKLNFGSWTLPAASLAVFVPRSNLGPWSQKDRIHLCKDMSQARVTQDAVPEQR